MISNYNQTRKCAYIHDRFVWWMIPRRSFNINNEYSIELLRIDHQAGSCQILITNLKTRETQELSQPIDRMIPEQVYRPSYEPTCSQQAPYQTNDLGLDLDEDDSYSNHTNMNYRI